MCKERLEVSFKGGKRAGDKTKVEPRGEGRKRREEGGRGEQDGIPRTERLGEKRRP